MTETPHEPAQPDAEHASADELAGDEVEPEHDADPGSFTDEDGSEDG